MALLPPLQHRHTEPGPGQAAGDDDAAAVAGAHHDCVVKAWAGTLVVLATPIGLLATSPQPAAANCDIPGNIAISDARVYEGTGPYPLFSVLAFRVTSSGNATSIDYAATRMVPPPGWCRPPGGARPPPATTSPSRARSPSTGTRRR